MSFSSSQPGEALAGALTSQTGGYSDLYRQIDDAAAQAWADMEAQRSAAQLASDTAEQQRKAEIEAEIAAALQPSSTSTEAASNGTGATADHSVQPAR